MNWDEEEYGRRKRRRGLGRGWEDIGGEGRGRLLWAVGSDKMKVIESYARESGTIADWASLALWLPAVLLLHSSPTWRTKGRRRRVIYTHKGDCCSAVRFPSYKWIIQLVWDFFFLSMSIMVNFVGLNFTVSFLYTHKGDYRSAVRLPSLQVDNSVSSWMVFQVS